MAKNATVDVQSHAYVAPNVARASAGVFARAALKYRGANEYGLVSAAGVGCGATLLPCEHVVVEAYPARMLM